MAGSPPRSDREFRVNVVAPVPIPNYVPYAVRDLAGRARVPPNPTSKYPYVGVCGKLHVSDLQGLKPLKKVEHDVVLLFLLRIKKA